MSGSSYQVQSTGAMNTLRAGWERLAYRHKFAEATLYLMFISGLILWDFIEVGWEIERVMLISHLLAGLTIFPLIVGPFWASHRNLMTGSKKRFLRTTGRLVEFLLIICTASGVYLMLYGNPGNLTGQLVQDVHFYSSMLLIPVVFRHAMRWSVLKVFNLAQLVLKSFNNRTAVIPAFAGMT